MAHEQPAVRTTIVGGRPPGSGQGIGPVPNGIEILLKKAAVDPAFRDLLLARRAHAAEAIALQLTPGEAGLLAAVPPAQLQAMVDGTRVPERQRAAFLSGAAAVMLAALGLSGCGGEEPKVAGIRPEIQPPPPTPGQAATTAAPTPGSDAPSQAITRGVRPDIPVQLGDGSATQPQIRVCAGVLIDIPPDGRPPVKGIQPDIPPSKE